MALALRRYGRRTGRAPLAGLWGLLALIAVGVLAWLLLPSAPLSLSAPERQGLRLAGGLTLLILDRIAGTTFFDANRGGDVLLWQNVFWFYSHPAVYIMVLPGMGILSDVLSTHSRKPLPPLMTSIASRSNSYS